MWEALAEGIREPMKGDFSNECDMLTMTDIGNRVSTLILVNVKKALGSTVGAPGYYERPHWPAKPGLAPKLFNRVPE